MKKSFFVIIFSFFLSSPHAQVISDSMRVDWSNAGYEGVIPDPQTIIDVSDYGAIPNDNLSDYSAIINAMNALSGYAGVLYFPAGVYNIDSTLNLVDSTVLRGAGSDSTVLQFDFSNLGGDGIRIWKGQSASFVNVISGYEKGSMKLVVEDASSFATGNYAELKETNGTWDVVPESWATDCVGQIVKITDVADDTLFIDEALRINYDASLQPQIRVYTPITNVGIECLKIVKADSIAPIVSYNISFLGAADCWINGVESDHSIGAHVSADLSTHLQISGCYFHHAYEYDGVSTHGYGVMLIQHSGDCLIENNFFKHLRHAMMVKQGANGNVFAYNYSIEPTRTEFPTNASGDISLHGHYAFANLFEGNIVQTLYIDQTYGPSGPFNTFFRNREDLYGIIITQSVVTTDKNNFVGNEITNTAFPFGLYLITGNEHFLWGNNRQGIIDPAGTDSLPDLSYYYSSAPNFWTGGIPFPPIGIPNEISSNSIPAKDRYDNGGMITQCGLPVATGSDPLLSAGKNSFTVWPNPFISEIHLTFNKNFKKEDFQITLLDLEGTRVFQQQISSSGQISFLLPPALSPGCYFLHLTNPSRNESMMIIKQ
jgi:hypothetical protein